VGLEGMVRSLHLFVVDEFAIIEQFKVKESEKACEEAREKMLLNPLHLSHQAAGADIILITPFKGTQRGGRLAYRLWVVKTIIDIDPRECDHDDEPWMREDDHYYCGPYGYQRECDLIGGQAGRPARRRNARITAPLIVECHANFEYRLADDALVDKHNFFICEVVKAHVAKSPKHPETLHYEGDGVFMVSARLSADDHKRATASSKRT
jgi:hypothetical protein